MIRKRFESGFKARVALETIKGEKTLAQISSEYGVHVNQASKWKHELLKGAAGIFGRNNGKQDNGQEEKIGELYKIIGELKVENDWFKKKLQQLD